jgi:hypothetical protein
MPHHEADMIKRLLALGVVIAAFLLGWAFYISWQASQMPPAARDLYIASWVTPYLTVTSVLVIGFVAAAMAAFVVGITRR